MKSFPLRRPRAVLATIAVGAASALALGLGLSGCTPGGGQPFDTVGTLDFERPLSIPPLAESRLDGDTRVFTLTAESGTSEFLPGVTSATWGFNGSYLGPTIVAERGEKVRVEIHNTLDEATTVHWHGMHLPPEMDGGPHQMIEAGASWAPNWTIDQPAGTLWYHPHPHGETESHVARGLAGMLLLHDEEEALLGLPAAYGVDDVPVIVQDVRIGADGTLGGGSHGFAGPTGDRVLVNGTLEPYLEVQSELVRLRLLNASVARVYNFALSDARPFTLIGTDGGLLTAPLEQDRVQLSPGERADVLVAMRPGERVTMRSAPAGLGIPDVLAPGNAGADRFDVLQLRAAPELRASNPIPATLASFERMPREAASVTRDFELTGFQINDRMMDMARIDEVVELGATEIWRVINTNSLPHSFHIHDVQFQVLAVDGSPPPPELAGWKDTVYLTPDRQFELIMRFEDFSDPDTPYMYHCHLLRHEDSGMMGQFVVVKPGQQPTAIDDTTPAGDTIGGDDHEH